ncbi:MAG: nucleotidyltransferase [Planctomycetes bacterium]|nr:nucleotidyltransferase [Planctomycetota bacterium]
MEKTFLNRDYKDMLRCLNDHGVRYIVVGAYALAVQGFIRYTRDIDIWVESTEENSILIYKALQEFGAPMEEIDKTTFAERGTIFQIGVEPTRIDLITEISGEVNFQIAFSRAVEKYVDEIPIRFLGVEDLIENKTATGRTKDKLDVKELTDRIVNTKDKNEKQK